MAVRIDTVYAPALFFSRDRRYEAIASLCHRFNVTRVARVIAERFPELLNVGSQVGFFDKSVGPEPLHQLFFPNNSPTVFDENEQSVE